MNKFVKVALDAAEKAAEIISNSYGKVTAIIDKKPSDLKDFVTKVDRQAESEIVKHLQTSFPNYSIWGEEFGKINKSKDYLWVIDPIDGTKNFVRQLGQFAISIGLFKEGNPYIGVIYNPLENKAFWAVAGEGAFLDKKRVKVSETKNLQNAAVAINFGKTKRLRRSSLKAIESIYTDIPIIRMPGSTSFVISEMVQGKYDALIDNVDFWDVAASLVILKEAGGKVTTWKGKEVKKNSVFILWSNGLLHSQLIERLSKIVTEKNE